MEQAPTRSEKATGFWRKIGAAIGALARNSGCSLNHSPLPEIREAAREWRDGKR